MESFTLLKGNIDLSESELTGLSKFAKFRNILAHEYQDITPEMTLKNIVNIIDLFPKYLKEIKKSI